MSEDNGFVSIKPNSSLITPTRWLWKNIISVGGLSLLIGNEEVGKGFLAVHLMAKLTHGKLPGCYSGKPVNVEIVAYEDSEAEWNKRMYAAGADDKYWSILGREDSSMLDFRQDTVGVVEHWKEGKFKFVYIDQLHDHLGVPTDSYNNKQMREALLPVHSHLTEAGISALGANHPNKRGSSIREKVNGSVATLAVVRSALYVAKHPDDEETRVLIPVKNNRGPKLGAMEFEIVDTPRDFRPAGRYVKTGVVQSLRPSKLTYEDLQGSDGTRKGELDAKMRSFLGDGKWHWFSDLREHFPDEDYNFNVLKRCAARLNVKIDSGGYPRRTRWKL